jgi:SNF2 family DNA or RNA helicase
VEYELAQQMVANVGKEEVELSDAMFEWAQRQKQIHDSIDKIVQAEDAKLTYLPKRLPKLSKTLRPFQRAGIKYGAMMDNVLIADKPGLGKTLEAIGIIYESQNEGPTLISAPLTSLETVWEYELNRWVPEALVLNARGSDANKEEALYDAMVAYETGEPFFLLVNPAMLMKKKAKDEEDKEVLVNRYDVLYEIEWQNIVVDECHRHAVRNPNTVTAKGIYDLKLAEGGKIIDLSGTPMGGKPINLWGILHHLHPERFTSMYRWAYQWLDVDKTRYGTEIGDIRGGMEKKFYRHLAPYMLSRTKEEVLKDLPPKDNIQLWCDMTPKQEAQYKKMARDARIQIENEDLSATSILALYTRLKQFADARCIIRDGKVIPENDSGKIEVLLEKLGEIGIIDGDNGTWKVGTSDSQAVIFSQFAEMAKLVYQILSDIGVPTSLMIGGTKDRAEIQRSFQAGQEKVIVMTTDTGGVSITLDRADYAFILDEKWNPDDQEQATDRIHRASRIHQVTVYWLRTAKSIEEYIKQITDRKDLLNVKVLKGIKLMEGN